MHYKIALAQINVTVGGISENTRKIITVIDRAQKNGADIVLFPELTISAYPPLDLILDNEFVTACGKALDNIREQVGNIIAIVGVVHDDGKHRYNALAVIQDGKIIDYVYKTNMPTYDVFDELRYFHFNTNPDPVRVTIRGKECKLGIQICEDLWDDAYEIKVTDELARKGADIILNASASPYHIGKIKERISLVRAKAEALSLPFVYVNLVGGQDELIFDGNSFAVDAEGKFAAYLPASSEAVDYCEFENGYSQKTVPEPQIDEMKELRAALVLGIRDYFYKSGFQDAIIGLSGGIDSALVAVLAAEALGPEHVYTYAMPSQFSSSHSLEDAEQCAKNLGVYYDLIPIKNIYDAFIKGLQKPFKGTSFGLAEENLQARIRGSILMSISNKKNALVLTTGNKTEIALGYCTLYGDMCGALGPISDLNKLEVYRISRHLNEQYQYAVIPENTIRKRPSAELAEDQYDPFDYNIVSPLVDDLLYQRKNVGELIKESKNPEMISEIFDLIRKNEYKRWQAAPGLRVTPKAFGQGRRMPMVNHFSI
ncbi:MAG: NAD+ synthase [Candidatus Marinimicrobia bacterium]|nr:NAD+ synthase [Candidatus Neomarinimicrobiota bacterium]